MRRMAMMLMTTIVAVAALGCGNSSSDSGSNVEPVQTEVSIPQGDKHAFELSGKFSEKVSGMSASVRVNGGETTVELSAVGAGDLTSTRFVFEGKAGTTGTVETIKTAQLTRSRTQYTNTSPLRVTVEQYTDSEVAGKWAGKFTEKNAGGEKQRLDEPIRIEGRFEFEYGN